MLTDGFAPSVSFFFGSVHKSAAVRPRTDCPPALQFMSVPSDQKRSFTSVGKQGLQSGLHWLKWLGRHELATIISLLVICVGIWGFLELADEVIEGETDDLDRQLLLWLRNPADLADPIGPPWVEEMMRDLTALGGVAVQTIITLATLGFLLVSRKPRAMLLIAVAIAGGWGVSTALKAGFDRARPDLVPHGSIVHTSSFPSGHSMMAATTFLTLGAVMARVHRDLRTKAYLLLLAVLLTVLVGVSRVYLGVHWPTDVLAGWTVGGCWALLCWTIANLLQRKGRVEQVAAYDE